MKNTPPNYNIPNIQEILTFSSMLIKRKADREEMYKRISFHANNNDELEGIKLFLDDNQRDFNKLHKFLKPNIIPIESKQPKKLANQLFKYAASITVVLGIVLYFNVESKSFHKRINHYCFKDNSFIVAAGVSNVINLEDLVNLYRQEKSAEAIKIIEGANLSINRDTINYLSGLIYLQANKYDKAESKLKTIESTDLKVKATYFLAITLLHKKKYNEAKALFIQTAKSTNDTFIQTMCTGIINDKQIWQN